MDMTIQNYSEHHVNFVVKMEGNDYIRFTGFYGYLNPNKRHLL